MIVFNKVTSEYVIEYNPFGGIFQIIHTEY